MCLSSLLSFAVAVVTIDGAIDGVLLVWLFVLQKTEEPHTRALKFKANQPTPPPSSLHSNVSSEVASFKMLVMELLVSRGNFGQEGRKSPGLTR